MSYLVAAQSALFYFLACTPCLQLQHQHKTRQQAKRDREMKERIVMEQPHLYIHPDPFHTNPYWDEEIRMGPSLPKKRKNSDAASKSTSQRRLMAASRDGGRPSIGTGSSVVVSMSDMASIASPRPSTSPVPLAGVESTPTVVPEEDPTSPTLSKTVSISTSADWNMKRYQREDEELWGSEPSWSGHKLMDAIKQAGTTAGRYMESKLRSERHVTEEDRYNFYFTPRNPPVNDYHPPVVSSKPAHKDALRWMLQPPPPAKVMEGKVPVTRSASMVSAASRRTVSTRDAGSLGRIVGERAVEARIRRGERPAEDEQRRTASLTRTRSRVSTTGGATRTRSRRTTRTTTSSSSTTTDSEDDDHLDMSRRANSRRRPQRRVSHRTPEVCSDDDDEPVPMPKSPESLSSSSLPGHAAQRPRLPTIMSSGYDDRGGSSGVEPDETVPPLPLALREIGNSPSKAAATPKLPTAPMALTVNTNVAIAA
ncbi:hypothetical protein C8A05DRAFT_17378 [Staphylotrichum tortipilum]|uniref:Uncharacterized protein n=1 Tax=Staphylotrichum tortipilum TaxID=2831512 RepID=A0AAN6RRN7_9PEZI|nr:hypothetical protein C8A05DRAFT_17378 [Staphylotrichum longicolle]